MEPARPGPVGGTGEMVLDDAVLPSSSDEITDDDLYWGKYCDDKTFVKDEVKPGKEITATLTWDDSKALFGDTLECRELFEEFIGRPEERFKEKERMREEEKEKNYNKYQLKESQSASFTYPLLMMHGKEFHAVPVGSWYNPSKISQRKELNVEEVEDKMKRTSNATGYGQWMMKSATHGRDSFGSDTKNLDVVNSKAAGWIKSKKENMRNHFDKGEEDKEERAPRRNVHWLTTKGVDDEEGGIKDFDSDFHIKIGDDWEHEEANEAFSDDDATIYVDSDGYGLADTRNPSPPEIKQDDNEDGKGAGVLSKTGKELKGLLRGDNGQTESDDDDQEDTDEDESPSPILAPKLQVEFESEPQEKNNPAKLTTTELPICTPPASRSNQKRRSGSDDAKTSIDASPKTEHTLEEDEEKMKKRSNTTGYERWMMESATHGAAPFSSDLKNLDDVNGNSVHEYDATQVFVDLFGTCISMQENISLLTVKLLIEAACEKAGMKITDVYSTFCGKILKPEHPLSKYEIRKDSTIRVSHRVRGGGWPKATNINTWDDIIKGKSPYHTVNLPAGLVSSKTKKKSGTYLSEHFSYHSRLVLIGMCRLHFGGSSLRGRFTSSQLLFVNAQFQFDDSIFLEPYSRAFAELDYGEIAQIFHKAFYDETNKTYPLHVDNLMKFLLTPPAHAVLDSDAVIAYLTNHYSVLSYTERVAVSEILDCLVGRLSLFNQRILASCLRPSKWEGLVTDVYEMNNVYLYDAQRDQQGNLMYVPYQSNGGTGLQCLKFSDNYFKHCGRFAGSSLSLEMIEASFSVVMEDENFLPNLLEDFFFTSVKYLKPFPVEIQLLINNLITLLGNNTIGCKRK